MYDRIYLFWASYAACLSALRASVLISVMARHVKQYRVILNMYVITNHDRGAGMVEKCTDSDISLGCATLTR